jgi:DNA-binding phage protein
MTLLKVLSTEDIKALVDKAGSVYNLSLQTGVREVSIYRYLNGTAEPTIATLRKLNSICEEVENETLQT